MDLESIYNIQIQQARLKSLILSRHDFYNDVPKYCENCIKIKELQGIEYEGLCNGTWRPVWNPDFINNIALCVVEGLSHKKRCKFEALRSKGSIK